MEKWTDGLAGSTGAGGFLESRGRLVYVGSFGLTCAEEFSIVMLRLCEYQLRFSDVNLSRTAYIDSS
jgi:hypothetical protein